MLKVLGTGGSCMLSWDVKLSVSGLRTFSYFKDICHTWPWVKTLQHFFNAIQALNPLLRNPVQEIWVSTARNVIAAVGKGGILCSVCLYGPFEGSYIEQALLHLLNKVYKQESF